MSPSDDPRMAVFTLDQQSRFVAAVIKDDTGEKLEATRGISPDVFTDLKARAAWRVMRRRKDYDEKVRHADVLPFFAVETSELQWVTDRRLAAVGEFLLSGNAAVLLATGPTKAKTDELWQRMQSRRFDRKNPITQPTPRFYIAGKGVCTPGNLSSIVADSGVGKSNFLGAFIAAVSIADNGQEDCDTLGVTASPPDGRVVLHIDTEQSPADHYASVLRALVRAKRDGQPDWLHSFYLTDFSATEQRAAVGALIQKIEQQIHSIILDGGADLLIDVNDAAESNELVAELRKLALEADAPLLVVIHGNPGDRNGKGRGHFGSQFDRKAESVLHLQRANDVTTVKSKKSRKAPILDSDGVAFEWSDAAAMHVTSASKAAKAEVKVSELRSLMERIFAGKKSLKSTQLTKLCMEITERGKSTADTRRKKAGEAGIIGKNQLGEYVLLPEVTTLMK